MLGAKPVYMLVWCTCLVLFSTAESPVQAPRKAVYQRNSRQRTLAEGCFPSTPALTIRRGSAISHAFVGVVLGGPADVFGGFLRSAKCAAFPVNTRRDPQCLTSTTNDDLSRRDGNSRKQGCKFVVVSAEGSRRPDSALARRQLNAGSLVIFWLNTQLIKPTHDLHEC